MKGRRFNAGCRDLIQERLEIVMIGFIQKNNLKPLFFKPFAEIQSCKTSSDNHDTLEFCRARNIH